MRGATTRDELLEGRAVERASIHWKFKGAGELVWNITSGRFETFQLAGREDVTSEVFFRIPKRDTPVTNSVSMSGSLKLSAEAAAKP